MALRVLLGIIGVAGLVLGIWVFRYESRDRPSKLSGRERFYAWMLGLDSFMPAFGWLSWMGLFGMFVSYSVTGEVVA